MRTHGSFFPPANSPSFSCFQSLLCFLLPSSPFCFRIKHAGDGGKGEKEWEHIPFRSKKKNYWKISWPLLRSTKLLTRSRKKFTVFSQWLVFNQRSAIVSWLCGHGDKSFASYFGGSSCRHHHFINLLISFVITDLSDFSPFQELCMNLTSRSIWPLSSQLLNVRFRHLKLCVKTLHSGSNEPITFFPPQKACSPGAQNCVIQVLPRVSFYRGCL